jgi:antitoxin MazE
MQTRIQKWGNSLAVRIPKAFAHEAHLEQDAVVELSLVDGKVVMVPVAEPEVTLEQLLSGITEENRHREIDWGPAVGKEVW